MIVDDDQLQQTRKEVADLEALIGAIEAGAAGDEGFRDLQVAGLRSHVEDLRDEIEEYVLRYRSWPE